jgi:hypothetical protein
MSWVTANSKKPGLLSKARIRGFFLIFFRIKNESEPKLEVALLLDDRNGGETIDTISVNY